MNYKEMSGRTLLEKFHYFLEIKNRRDKYDEKVKNEISLMWDELLRRLQELPKKYGK
jgi:hypothetical protein